MKDSIYYLDIDRYIKQRNELNEYQQSMFDFMYCTGARVSEVLKIEPRHFNFEKRTVFIPTLKNPNSPIREVRMAPINPLFYNNIRTIVDEVEEGKVWIKPGWKEPRKYIWKLSKKFFKCTTHSFRHTHATILVRDYGANLHELMQEMGWSDPKPAMIYVSYAFGESLDKKILEYYQKNQKGY